MHTYSMIADQILYVNKHFISSYFKGNVNLLLAKAAEKNSLIKMKYNHKLVEIDFNSKELEFKTASKDGTTRYYFYISL